MGEFAEELIDQEMFGLNDGYSYKSKGKYKGTRYYSLTPAEKKIASIRKEIAIDVKKNGLTIDEARKKANQKYGKGWRERGLVSNSDNQWSDADLREFI